MNTSTSRNNFTEGSCFDWIFFCLESLTERRGSLSEAGPCWNSEDRNCCRNVSSDLDWFSSHQDLKWFQRDLSHHIGKQKSPVKWNSHSLLKIGVKFYTLIDPHFTHGLRISSNLSFLATQKIIKNILP